MKTVEKIAERCVDRWAEMGGRKRTYADLEHLICAAIRTALRAYEDGEMTKSWMLDRG